MAWNILNWVPLSLSQNSLKPTYSNLDFQKKFVRLCHLPPPQTKFLDPPLNAADIFATVGLATDAESFYWSLVRSTSVFPRLFLPPIFWKLLSFVGFCVHSGSSQRLIRVLCTIILALNSNLLCRYMLTWCICVTLEVFLSHTKILLRSLPKL